MNYVENGLAEMFLSVEDTHLFNPRMVPLRDMMGGYIWFTYAHNALQLLKNLPYDTIVLYGLFNTHHLSSFLAHKFA